MSYDSKGVRSVTQGRASSAEEKNMPAPSANDSKRPSASAALDLTPYTDKDQEIARDAETPVKAFYTDLKFQMKIANTMAEPRTSAMHSA